MRSVIFPLVATLFFSINIYAQNYKTVVVKAGTSMKEYFSMKDRYRYSQFSTGKAVFKNGTSKNLNFNYNYLNGEIEFVQGNDTMYIPKKKELMYVVAPDTFYYDNGYIENISGGTLKVGLKQYVRLKDILKQGAFGTTNRSGTIETYSSVWADGNSYSLIPKEDIEVQMTLEYYLSNSPGTFILFNKKNSIQLYPLSEDKIKAYIKSNKVDFDSRSDLLKFADFLRGL